MLLLIVAVPSVGVPMLAIVSGSPSGSESLASELIVTGWPDAVVAASFTATGGWFGCAATVITTFAVALPPRPSSIVYVKRSAGVYVIVAPFATTLPFVGVVTPVIVSGSLSGSESLASTLTVTGWP